MAALSSMSRPTGYRDQTGTPAPMSDQLARTRGYPPHLTQSRDQTSSWAAKGYQKLERLYKPTLSNPLREFDLDAIEAKIDNKWPIEIPEYLELLIKAVIALLRCGLKEDALFYREWITKLTWTEKLYNLVWKKGVNVPPTVDRDVNVAYADACVKHAIQVMKERKHAKLAKFEAAVREYEKRDGGNEVEDVEMLPRSPESVETEIITEPLPKSAGFGWNGGSVERQSTLYRRGDRGHRRI